MTKIRKQKRKKVYKYNVNRKKQKNKMRRRPKVLCDHLKKEWDNTKAPKQNMLEMGLSIDANETLKLPPNKPLNMELDEEEPPKPLIADKTYVAKNMELDAKAPRQKNFRLPNSQVEWLTKLLDKYGEDYKAMVKDRKLNCFQETWKQLRHKINRFKSIPEQYGEYLEKKETEKLEMESSNSNNDS
uniref:Nucleolar protein 16 n=1 Tax=Panstrongylus megistus TaxID=65343 RepID=A0A069DNX5_9HEMI